MSMLKLGGYDGKQGMRGNGSDEVLARVDLSRDPFHTPPALRVVLDLVFHP